MLSTSLSDTQIWTHASNSWSSQSVFESIPDSNSAKLKIVLWLLEKRIVIINTKLHPTKLFNINILYLSLIQSCTATATVCVAQLLWGWKLRKTFTRETRDLWGEFHLRFETVRSHNWPQNFELFILWSSKHNCEKQIDWMLFLDIGTFSIFNQLFV